MPYLDTSILGSYYCPESLSGAVNTALATVTMPIIGSLVEVEFCSLLSLKVRTRTMDRATAIATLAQFQIHVADGLFKVVEATEREYELARTWLARFDTSLRTLDALHLAMAVANGEEIWTTDKALGYAARKIGAKARVIA